MRALLLAALALAGCRDRANAAADAALDAPPSDARPDTDAGATSGSGDVSEGGARADLSDAALAARPMLEGDWEIARGEWRFEGGELACACKTISSLVYWRRDRPKDFDASVEVRFDVVESSAGIVFREAGDDFIANASFYQYEWYTRGTHHDRRLSLMIKNPYWVQIVDPIMREPALGTWIRFRVRARGDRMETWIDGEPVFDKVDATFARAGRIGIHVYQPRPIRLRDFRLDVDGASR